MFRLEFFSYFADTVSMDMGQTIYISSQLVLGALTAFLAILLWPKIRDPAWMLIIFGSIIAYIETVYSILNIFGINGEELIVFGSIPVISLILPTIRMTFFIIAFAIMVFRQSRSK